MDEAEIDRMVRRLESRKRAVVEVDFIAKRAIEHWEKDGLDFYLCETPIKEDLEKMKDIPELKKAHSLLRRLGELNGYVCFPKLPGLIPGYHGIYTYVPVHGGITFFQEWADGSCTYGFDTGHSDSYKSPIRDKGWMKLETESMARGIQIAARFEPYYLKAGEDNQKKARVLDRMGKFLPLVIMGNFGAMMNLLSGDL
jgi:hypothetical protein